jgi:hypothetical protein
MSYATIFQNAVDEPFQNRLTACVAQEGADDPTTAMRELIWPVVTASDVEAAYESAIAASNPNPGGDPSVITDAMILAKVQANMPPVV